MTLAERLALIVCGLCLGSAWAAEETPDKAPAEEPVSDVEFIEYLGLWEESDEEWLMHAEVQNSEDLPEMEPETKDES